MLRSGPFLRFLLPAFCAGMVAVSCGGDTPESPTCDGDCQTPPAAVCEGDRAISFSLFGECSNGQCVYPPVVVDCAADGGTCQAGACVAPPDPCDGVVCDQPPATNCEGDTLNQYAADSGECVDGGCTYEVQQTDCAARRQVCEDGACVTPVNLCAGILCEEPPADGCDGESAVTYVDEGECNPDDGECLYAEVTRRDCAAEGLFCNNARCQAENPCAGITCNTPPENFCNENDNAVVYVARGTCAGGECSYLESVRDCDNATEVCEDGACRDRLPCDGVVCDRPPAATCRGTLRNFYEPLGTCTDGRCTYVLRSQECSATDQICQGDACVDPDACFGVVCNSIPATECRGDTVVSYRAGSCELPGGACSYPEVTLDCAASGRSCVDGACEITDPCAGVNCLTPPAAECLDDIVVEYLSPGECNPETGLCDFDPIFNDCTEVPGLTCEAGVCVIADPCEGVECPAREPFCESGTNTLVSYSDVGECIAGACDYSGFEERVDCGAALRSCVDGAGCVGQGTLLAEGDLRITEYFAGTDDLGPLVWIEVYNPFGSDQPVEGLAVVFDNGLSTVEYTFEEGVVVPAGGFLVAGTRELSGVETIVIASGLPAEDFLSFVTAGSLAIRLQNASEVVAALSVSIGGEPTPGASRQVDPGSNDPDSVQAWCDSVDATGVESIMSSAGGFNHACASRLAGSGLMLSEIMVNGADLPFGDDRWFELLNQSSATINLAGIDVVWGQTTSPAEPTGGFRITQPVFVAGGDRSLVVVTSVNLGASPGLFERLTWPDEDGVLLFRAADTDLFQVQWGAGGIATEEGRSNEVSDESAGTPADPMGWCQSAGTYGVFFPSFGTPGSTSSCR
jgi:hypothetical protein